MVAQRMNKICKIIEIPGSFIGALNVEENICRRGIKCSEELLGQNKEKH